MRIRRDFLPRSIGDIATTLFLTIVVPITYWFELWIVMPEFMSTNSFFYYFNFLFGTFLMFNIGSNMIAIMLCNTSIVGKQFDQPSESSRKFWKYCSVCETITPPRSWHCEICRVCILKRDHHCMFTGWIYRLFHSVASLITVYLLFQVAALVTIIIVTSCTWSFTCSSALRTVRFSIICTYFRCKRHASKIHCQF